MLLLVQATAVEELRRGADVEEPRREAAVEELRRGAAVEGLYGLQERGVTTVAEVVYSVTGKTMVNSSQIYIVKYWWIFANKLGDFSCCRRHIPIRCNIIKIQFLGNFVVKI